MVLKFEVNRCFHDATKDEVYEFKTLNDMRNFIDIDPCYPMEVAVYKMVSRSLHCRILATGMMINTQL